MSVRVGGMDSNEQVKGEKAFKFKQWFSIWLLREYVAMTVDIFVCYNWGLLV